MERYNNINYSFKQAKRMLYVHKGKLQMGLPEWDKGDSIRLYTKPRIDEAIYKSYLELNPDLPKDPLYLPDNLYGDHLKISKLTEKNLGDIMTNNFLYKHIVREYKYSDTTQVNVDNIPWSPTAKEIRRKDWILYKL